MNNRMRLEDKLNKALKRTRGKAAAPIRLYFNATFQTQILALRDDTRPSICSELCGELAKVYLLFPVATFDS